MKNSKLMFFLLLLIPFGAPSANGYFEAETMLLTIDVSSPQQIETYTAEPTAVGFSIGLNMSPNVAVEGLLAIGGSDDQFYSNDSFDPALLRVKLNSLSGVYAVGKLPFAHAGAFFGKIGYASLQYEDSDGFTLDGSGMSYGLGANVNLGRNLSIMGEFMFYPEVSYDDAVYGFPVEGSSDSLNIGLQFRF